MSLIRSLLAGLSPRLAEGDPLPPDDRVTLGSTLVLDDLYRRQGPRLVRHIARQAGPQDAEDVLHDSFVRMARAQAGRDSAIEHPACGRQKRLAGRRRRSHHRRRHDQGW